MGRYSPTVRPTERDPLTEAINQLRGSFGQASRSTQDRIRQEELDEERRKAREQDIDFRQGEQEYRRERDERRDTIQDLDLHERGYRRGRAPAEMPQHEILPQEDDELAATFEALRSQGFQRPQPEPPAPTPGAFVPGQGFNLRFRGQPAGGPQPGAAQPQATDMQPGGMSPSPYATPNLGARRDPRFEQVTDDYYRDPEATPEARARAREAEQERMILERLLAHPEVDETEAPLIAGGQMRFGDAIDPDEFDPATDPELLRERAMAGEGLGRYNQGGEYDPERDAILQRERMLEREGLGRYAGKTEEESATYQNLTKLLPPVTPVQEAAARAIADGANTPEKIKAMAQEAGLTEEQTAEALEYLKEARYRSGNR